MGGLDDLPSSGLLTAVQPGAAFTTRPVAFVADYDTSPPANQINIKTDPTSLLIRSIQNRKAQEDARRKAARTKRPAADGDTNKAAKKAAIAPTAAGGAGPSSSASAIPPPDKATYTRPQLTTYTVKELQGILRAWEMPVSGKKDDLIARILGKMG